MFRVYRSLNRCHNNAETSHPLKETGCCFGNNRGLTASRQFTEPAVLFFYHSWFPRSLLCISELHPATVQSTKNMLDFSSECSYIVNTIQSKTNNKVVTVKRYFMYLSFNSGEYNINLSLSTVHFFGMKSNV